MIEEAEQLAQTIRNTKIKRTIKALIKTIEKQDKKYRALLDSYWNLYETTNYSKPTPAFASGDSEASD